MHKIVKHFGYGFESAEPVAISNKVHIPLTPEQAALSKEKLLDLENEKKLDEERLFRENVDNEVNRILAERSEQLEKERIRILENARKSAETMTADAKATTISVLEKTTKECTLLKAQAEQEGYNDGFNKGHSEAAEKCRRYIDSAAKLLSDINSRKDAYYLSNEKELRDTVFLMAEKIVKAELEVNPLVTERIIADAAKGYRNSDYIKISVSECDIKEKIKTDKNFINKLIPFIKDIDIEFLDDAPEGTVMLDDNKTITDASIPTQLDFLKEILKNTRGDEQ